MRAIRKRVSEFRELERPFDQGEAEIDGSYFGASPVRGFRGRGAGEKIVVFGLVNLKGSVRTSC